MYTYHLDYLQLRILFSPLHSLAKYAVLTTKIICTILILNITETHSANYEAIYEIIVLKYFYPYVEKQLLEESLKIRSPPVPRPPTGERQQ